MQVYISRRCPVSPAAGSHHPSTHVICGAMSTVQFGFISSFPVRMPRLLQVFRHGTGYIRNSRSLSQSNTMTIFDSKVKRIQRERALSSADSHLYDYLKEEVAFRVADRVFDIKRFVKGAVIYCHINKWFFLIPIRHFTKIVDLGCYKGHIASNLSNASWSISLYNIVIVIFTIFSVVQDTVDTIICCSSSQNSLVIMFTLFWYNKILFNC